MLVIGPSPAAGRVTSWPELRKDSSPPTVKALPSSGRAGTKIKLLYQVADDSGVSRDEITVYRGGTLLHRELIKWGKAEQGKTYFVRWRPPRGTVGTLRFCVRSKDRAGNWSGRSCAPLTVRPA